MKILFLDIDGVLNCDSTKEKVGFGRYRHFLGLDQRLLKLLLDWLKRHSEVKLVISSTWRLDPDQLTVMAFSGLRWIGVTPNLGHRGKEIDAWLAGAGLALHNVEPAEYAILDDIRQFHPWQMSHFVQTSPIHGLREKNLRKLERILNLNPPSSNGRTADFESAN